MSNGPVYCPNDKTELKYGQGGFECPACGLWWCGQFPVRDNRVDGKVLQFGQLHNRYAALKSENAKLRGVVEAVESELNCVQDAEPAKGNAPIRAARAIIHLYKTAALSNDKAQNEPTKEKP